MDLLLAQQGVGDGMSRVVMGLTVAAVFALTGCGADEAAESQGPESGVSPAQRQLEERIADLESQVRRARGEARRERAKAGGVREADAAAAPAGRGGIVVPDVVGLDHQAAQDALQGEGLWLLDEEDCSGQGRALLWDRNWEVVSTAPPAGAVVSPDTTITLCSVKEDER